MSDGFVKCFGWEMVNTTGTSDKFYRVVIIDNMLITNWGARTAARGQVKTTPYLSAQTARQQARELTNAKEAKGYVLSRDFTDFTLVLSTVRTLREVVDNHESGMISRLSLQLIDTFKNTSHKRGTAKQGTTP